jgi:hypothetical protein
MVIRAWKGPDFCPVQGFPNVGGMTTSHIPSFDHSTYGFIMVYPTIDPFANHDVPQMDMSGVRPPDKPILFLK